MRIAILLTCCVFLYACDTRNTSSISYPTPPPTDSIVSFLPGIVCSSGDSIDFNATFSPDGKSFYFCRSQNRSWDIYETRHDGTSWRKPTRVELGGAQYSEADPAIGPDGFLYFISNMPKDEADTLADFDIWFAKPVAGGGWSKPENLSAVNSDSTEFYVSFTKHGDLYFASSRVGGYGMEDIYVSTKTGEGYSVPVNLGPQVNSPFSDHDPCVWEDENVLIYTSVERKDTYGEADLYYSVKTADGAWSPAVHMSKRVNTPTYEYCAYFSPDGRYFFYSSERDVKWTPVETLHNELKQK
jgi:hypothetical protein